MSMDESLLVFDWDEANINHIARHSILPHEAEEVILNGSFNLGTQEVEGEVRFPELGTTNSGRILVVVITPRGVKQRVVTAYTADSRRQDYWFKQTGRTL